MRTLQQALQEEELPDFLWDLVSAARARPLRTKIESCKAPDRQRGGSSIPYCCTAMTRPTIAVLGATGLQGGAVVTGLLKHDKFLVRAVTRNAAKAGDLAKKRDVEVVEADLGNKASLVKVSGNVAFIAH